MPQTNDDLSRLLRLLGPLFGSVAREELDRRLGDLGIPFLRGGTVVTAADDEGVARVHVDGDPADETQPATLTGLTVATGTRVQLLMGKSLLVIGELGGHVGTGGVDLSTYVQFADLAEIDWNALVTPQRTGYPFGMQGDAGVHVTVHEHVIFEPFRPLSARVVMEDVPTGTSCSYNFRYEGTRVLSTNLAVPISAQPGEAFTTQGFALTELIPAGFDGGSLRGEIVSVDTGDTGGNATLTLFGERFTP